MSVFRCEFCNQYCDSDNDDCDVHPQTGDEMCGNCFEAYQCDCHDDDHFDILSA